jgi:hypothetical protein
MDNSENSKPAEEIDRQDYDGEDDFRKSILVAFNAIRERMAQGGPGWDPK